MTNWQEVSALGTLASTIVVALATVVAVVQIRHLRLSNQLTTVLRIYEQFSSAEMADALRYCLSDLKHVVADETALRATAETDYDVRMWRLAAFYTEIGALVVDGFLDEHFVHRLMPTMARAWDVMSPIAMQLREHRVEPIWAEFEYVAELHRRRSPSVHLERYPKWFLISNLSGNGDDRRGR